MKILRKFPKKLATITSSLLLVIALTTSSVGALSIGGPSDCDNNAVIPCGAHSTAELKREYRNRPYVQKVFSAFGISNDDIQNIGSTAVRGKVTQKGNVYIEGQDTPVARGAVTAGRQDMSGSTPVTTNGITFYKRTPSVSFQRSSLPAYVVMRNGEFQYAVIASCGNPVTASPVVRTTTPAPAPAPTPPPAPAPTPAPTQSQSQSQSQSVVVQTVAQQPAPVPAPVAPATTTVVREVPVVHEVVSQPQALPNTGIAGGAGLFALVSSGGYLVFRRYLTRNLL